MIFAAGDAAANTANNTQILLAILGLMGAGGIWKGMALFLGRNKPKADIAQQMADAALGLTKGSDGLLARYIALTESQTTKLELLEKKISHQDVLMAEQQRQLMAQAGQLGELHGRYDHVESEKAQVIHERDQAIERVRQLEEFMRFTHVAIPPSLIDVQWAGDELDLPDTD